MKVAYLVLAVVMLIVVIFVGVQAKTLVFVPVTVPNIVGVLTPLFVIALFLERAQEVFVSAWREPQKKAYEAAGNATKLAEYQAETQRIAFLFGFVVSTLISVVGIRALAHLVMDPALAGRQLVLFKTVDVLLTAAIIGGGSEGIHKMVSVITDFLDVTRGKIQASAPQQPAVLPAPQAVPAALPPPQAAAGVLAQAAAQQAPPVAPHAAAPPQGAPGGAAQQALQPAPQPLAPQPGKG